MSKPIAAVISDVHYNMQTLEVADAAMRLAIAKANELEVPLIVCGDLHDTKANIRAECMNAMRRTFELCETMPIVLRGNHDSLNEKSAEHALEGLSDLINIVDNNELIRGFYFIAYQHDPETFKIILDSIPKSSTIFCHQGVKGANMGHYILDKSAVPIEWVKDYRVISGHYHIRQTIHSYGSIPPGLSVNGPKGLWDYIGNPYTLGFGEAHDPEKGFQILYDDGSVEFVPTNLRRHIIIEQNSPNISLEGTSNLKENDILWLKVTGTSEYLATLTKEKLAKCNRIKQDFKLDLIPLETNPNKENADTKPVSQSDQLDSIIDNLLNTADSSKLRVKDLWKKLATS